MRKTWGGKKEKEREIQKESVIRESHATISERDCKLGNIFSFQGSLELIILNVLLIPESSWSSSKYLAKALWCEAILKCIPCTNNNTTSHLRLRSLGHVFTLDTAIRAFVHTGWTAALFQHKASGLSEDALYRPAFGLIKTTEAFVNFECLSWQCQSSDIPLLTLLRFEKVARVRVHPWSTGGTLCSLPLSLEVFPLWQAYFSQKAFLFLFCFLFFLVPETSIGIYGKHSCFWVAGLLLCLSSSCVCSFHSRFCLTWCSQQCDPRGASGAHISAAELSQKPPSGVPG